MKTSRSYQACVTECFPSFSFQSLADQEAHLKVQIKELEANVLAAAPDKAKQKQMEKSLDAFKKGRVLLETEQIC